MTKGAIGQIIRSLAIDLGVYNIRVNAVCAGTIHTPLVDNLFVDFAKKENITIRHRSAREDTICVTANLYVSDYYGKSPCFARAFCV